jgi:hypothetical protein
VANLHRLHQRAETTPSIDEKSAEAARVIRRSKGYVLISDKLYKRGLAIGILMKCVQTEEGKAIFWEIHEGTCCNHVASRTLVGKSFRSGFYWPMALADTEELVRRCTKYQFFGKEAHFLAHNLNTIPPSWPFSCCSLDMIGPLTTALEGFTHVLVAIDKFTKWIEYKPIKKLSADQVVSFIWISCISSAFPTLSSRI